MQYANIIVNHKAGYDAFTYEIPASLLAHLAIGSVVLVPIGRNEVHGVIESFVRRLDSGVATKLKPIKSIAYAGAFVPNYILQAANLLHEQFGYGLNDLLFTFLPPLPKKPQPLLTYTTQPTTGYKTYEYIISAVTRAEAYSKIARSTLQTNRSLLLLCPSAFGARSLARYLQKQDLPVVLFPHTPKEQKEYYTLCLGNTTPTIYIGTRSALLTPLIKGGGIIIDEPWFPGHKEEHTPKLWTAIAAQALCKANNMPLYLVSSLPWPESQLIDSPKRYTVRSSFGNVRLLPKRNISEEIAAFLAEYDGIGQQLAIFIREEKQQVGWCIDCKYASYSGDQCQLCGKPFTRLPKVTKVSLRRDLAACNPKSRIDIFSSDELFQYKTYDAALILGFDVFLSIVDFRASAYLVSLLYIIGSQAKQTLFATSYPDDWTQLIHKDVTYFAKQEITERCLHNLPPFSWAIQLTAKQKVTLEKLLTSLSSNPQNRNLTESIIQVGKIRKHADTYVLPLLVKRSAKIPSEWHKKSDIKIDILPNYID